MARDEETPRTLDESLRRDSLEGKTVDELVATFKRAAKDTDRLREEQAQVIAKLNREFKLSFDVIAQLLGVSRATAHRWAQDVPAE